MAPHIKRSNVIAAFLCPNARQIVSIDNINLLGNSLGTGWLSPRDSRPARELKMNCLMRLTLSIRTFVFLAILLGFGAAEISRAASSMGLNDTTWRPLRIGAGGWLTGLDISTDGSTRVVRTDTYGAYIWD